MNEVQSCFIAYVERYVDALTRGKEEYFLSLCDIEEEFLENLDVGAFTGYRVAVVDHRDYSEAVRLRNDVEIKKIVLLSGEGVKQIDSLKDFNEYSVLCEDRDILWDCLTGVLQADLERAVRTFLDVILDNGEVSFHDLLVYLIQSMDPGQEREDKGCGEGAGSRRFSVAGLNRNLPLLGIWKSKERRAVPGKVKIKRMIRTSRYAVMESRLTRAVMDHDGLTARQERIVSTCLSQGDIQGILSNLYYENVCDLLKGGGRNPGGKTAEETASSESRYTCSYEYLLSEQLEEGIVVTEERLLKERGTEEESSIVWGSYEKADHAKEEAEEQFRRLEEEIGMMNLPVEDIRGLTESLEEMKAAFFHAWDGLWTATPACLNQFCDIAEEYTDRYLKLLASFLVEDRNRYAVCGTRIAQSLQLLFCRRSARRISMPFYHPICVFHYMGIRRMYEDVVDRGYAGKLVGLKKRIQNAVIQKLGMDFPVEFLMAEGKKFALDHATVGWNDHVEFLDMEEGAIYSMWDFRLVSRQITDYLICHPLLTQITIGIVDIGDLGGLVGLVDRIRHISRGGQCNIGKVDLLILSAREEELKRRMSQIWDAAGGGELVRFRFGRQEYWDGKRYDMERIVRDSDLTVIGDCSVLYHAPRRGRERRDYNLLRSRVETLGLRTQVERYFQDGRSEIPVIWDTLQHVSESREEGFFRWRSRELDNGLIGFVNRQVAEHLEKSVVLLSSGEHVLSEIFRTDYVHAHRRKYNGKDMTLIAFDASHASEQLPAMGELRLSYSLKDFYHMALELDQIQQEIHPELEDLQLEIRYERGIVRCRCIAVGEAAAELKTEWMAGCREWMEWHMTQLPSRKDLMGRYFQELKVAHWHEKTRSLPEVLFVEKLAGSERFRMEYGTLEKAEEDYLTETEADCLEAVKIHEMIRFATDRAVLDEQTVSQFGEQYGEEMLARVLECDDRYRLLEQEKRNRLDGIYEWMRGERYHAKGK